MLLTGRLRHQLPAFSPIGARETRAAFRAALLGTPAAERAALARTIATALEAERALLTDSGTGALTLAIRAAAPAGSAIALPAYGCYDLATACDGAGSEVILYDVEPDSLGPDLESLGRAIKRGARAVVTAPAYGFTTHVSGARRLCDELGVPMIEDAAQCLGAMAVGGGAGTLGDFVVLSFGRGKGVTAGHGGALVVRRWLSGQESLGHLTKSRARPLREAATVLAVWTFGRPALYGIPAAVPALELGQTIYRTAPEPGLMSDVGVAVLESTWLGAREETGRRRAHAGRLLDLVRGCSALKPCRASDGSVPSYLRLPIVVTPEARARVELPAVRRMGIMPGYPRMLADLPGFGRRCRRDLGPYPGAAELAERLVTFPTHSRLEETDFRCLGAWVEGLQS